MSIFGIIRVAMAALHDVSKHDDTRLDPKANASDARAQRDASGTNSVNYVTDATDPLKIKDIIGGIFRIVGSGTINTPAVTATPGGAGLWGYGNGTTVKAHGLNFIPMVFAFLDYTAFGGGYIEMPYSDMFWTGTVPNWVSVNLITDATSITAQVSVSAITTPTTFPTVPIKYYLFQQTAN